MARDYWFAFGAQPSVSTGLAPTFITFVNGSGQTQAPPSIAETYVGTGLYKASYTPTQTIAFVLDGATTGLATSSRYIFGVFDPQDTMGVSSAAMGTTLVAIGNTAIALGNTGVALGTLNFALGTTGVALGTTGVALGNTGVALGTLNFALGTTNVALGTTNVALGITSIAFGVSTIAFGTTNVALGNTAIALLTNLGTSLGVQSASLVAMGNTLSTLATYVGSTASSFGNSATDPATVFGYAKRVVEFLEGNQVYTKSTGGLVFSSRGSSETIASKTVSDNTTQTTKT